LANAYADALIATNLRGKVDTSSKAEEYLRARLNEARVKLEDSERQMIEYARIADLTGSVMGASDTQSYTMPSRQMEQLGTSLADATSRRINAEQDWSQVRGTPPAQLPQVQENRAYQELLAQKAQLQAELADERARRTEEHPAIAAKATKIAALDSELVLLAANIKKSFEQRYRSAANQEAQLRMTVDQLRNAALSEQERAVGHKSLEREVETNRAAYAGLLQRFKEIAAAAGAPAANVSLVDRAEPPLEPSSAGPGYVLALALIVGMIVGMGLALLREFISGVMRSAEDVEAAVGMESLGVVPAPDRGMTIRDCLQDQRSPQSEAFKSIGAALNRLGDGTLPRSVLITSSVADEGKSTSIWGLARGLSALGYSVIIVNGDLRNPSAGPGLVDALAGRVEPRALVRQDRKTRIGIVDAGTADQDVISLLQPARMRSVLEQYEQMADIVLVDGPPVMGLVDAVLLTRSVETALVVVEANRITPSQLDHTVSRLPEDLPMATILTKFDARKAGTSYGSTNHYRYGKSPAWDIEAA
jgi:Mrp family chromosome partitioning ATPase/LPS O-antigen subunit length determinant protein (WzzB/FepE family)